MDLLVLSRADVEQLLDVDELIEALASGFRALSGGLVSVPARVAAFADAGLLGVMPGFVAGVGLEAKLVSVFAGNHAVGLPSHQAVICVFSETDGRPLALMDGTHITAVRTAATAALAVRVLARPEASVLCVVGAGVQGSSHLSAVPRVRSFAEIRVASRTFAHAQALAAACAVKCVAMPSIAEAVAGADVVCCCTHSSSPVVSRAWLADGAHVSSVGAAPEGPELDAATVEAGEVFVESRAAACAPFPAGSHELVGRDPSSVTELGEVLLGLRPGRSSASSITVWKSMGHAVEDAVAARLVLDAARAAGVGQTVQL